MMYDFIFDLDGTLTDARQYIDPEFEEFLHEFTGKHLCYICTGSDYPKVEEQLGKELTDKFDTVFACSGNHHISKGKEIYKSQWHLNGEQEWFLLSELKNIDYPWKTGNHLEKRIGTVNLSIPGRNATLEDREVFTTWDTRHKARIQLAEKFNKIYPQLEAIIGGETGLDITPHGKSKAQILEEFEEDSHIHFFGDKIIPGGNDYTLGIAVDQLKNGKSYNVENWQETYKILKARF